MAGVCTGHRHKARTSLEMRVAPVCAPIHFPGGGTCILGRGSSPSCVQNSQTGRNPSEQDHPMPSPINPAFPVAHAFHISLRVADLDRSTAFYGAFLGTELRDRTALQHLHRAEPAPEYTAAGRACRTPAWSSASAPTCSTHSRKRGTILVQGTRSITPGL
ncbi:VOC family protein [Metallibacterium scheffleri]|uniref:VOC family protein n=1 Tax=Metallibacterium scheffleri TaxID=993689 RepID=UPI003CCD2C5D